MGRRIGYIVIEYNQASGQPGLPLAPGIHDNREDAEEERAIMEEAMAMVGRRERYEIGTIELPEEGDDD